MVRLSPLGATLAVGEGIETMLAVMAGLGGDSRFTAWSFGAALTTYGLRALELPAEVKELVIFADADAPGEQAARALGQKALSEGRIARIARPVGAHAKDFNDVLMPMKET
jgi:putative DNA primase/helicase